jgi:hypothetical protein
MLTMWAVRIINSKKKLGIQPANHPYISSEIRFIAGMSSFHANEMGQ